MNIFEKLTSRFNELERLCAKYSAEGYKSANSSQVVYHEPETPEQKEMAKKIKIFFIGFFFSNTIMMLLNELC